MRRPLSPTLRRVLQLLLVLTFAALATSSAFLVAQIPAGERLGKVHFDNSCTPAIAPQFDRAMALLHSFEFSEASAAFEQVLKSDPGCGIAAWGIAMSTWGNPFGGLRAARVIQDGQTAVDRAQT